MTTTTMTAAVAAGPRRTLQLALLVVAGCLMAGGRAAVLLPPKMPEQLPKMPELPPKMPELAMLQLNQPHSEPRLQPEAADRYALPAGMLVGAGVSAVQTEGAWNEDGKAESLMDFAMGRAGNATANHFQAADSYHRYKEDVEMAAKLKLSVYKFSMSWARVLPTADASKPNWKGVQFYHNLIDEIRSKGMTPMVTLYHFDHPFSLEKEFGGWGGRQMVAKFEEYAKFAYAQYASKVNLWVTINEPNMYCSYFGMKMDELGMETANLQKAYQCLHNNNLAHAAAYRAFKAGNYPGRVGYSNLMVHAKPASTQPEDVYASEAFNAVSAGTTLHPVVYGDYPQIIKDLAGDNLPNVTAEDRALLKGTSDFFGLNVYFDLEVAYNPFHNSSGASGLVGLALGSMVAQLPFVTAYVKQSTFGTVDPGIIRNALLWTHQQYGLPIVITENGYADSKGLGVHDHERAVYFSSSLRSLVATVKDFGVDVIAFCAWSLIDSFEFSGGYGRPFGLVHVDFAGGSLNRTLKDSASFWTELRDTGVVPLVEPQAQSAAALGQPAAHLAVLLAGLAAAVGWASTSNQLLLSR